MHLSQAYLKYPFTRASRTRAGFGQPGSDQNVRKFWLWAKRTNPQFYNAVRRNAPHLLTQEGRAQESGPPGLGQLQTDPARIYSYELGAGESPAVASTNWGDKLMSIFQTIGAPLVGIYQQKKLMDINIKRAEQGLAPVDTSVLTPRVEVQVDLPPEIQQEITETARTTKQATQWILPIGLGLGALFLFQMMKKK